MFSVFDYTNLDIFSHTKKHYQDNNQSPLDPYQIYHCKSDKDQEDFNNDIGLLVMEYTAIFFTCKLQVLFKAL